ncbi:MAG: hypothetical protein Q9211_000844 [Gyalolechia sp. 1 TL-2023]
MMVPRAYAYASAPSHSSQQPKPGGAQNPIGQSGTRQVETTAAAAAAAKKQSQISKPPRMATISPVAPSKPVIIPTRIGLRQQPSGSRARAERPGRGPDVAHDAHAVPPSVAAFLAITDIRRKPALLLRGKRLKDRNEEDFEGAADHELGIASSSSASSPHSWRLLLSPPQDIIEDDESGFGNDDTTTGSFSPLRSLSNESMPSLETDNESGYASSSPSTPGIAMRGQAARERRLKSISSSVTEDSSSDHPLLIAYPKQEHAPRSKADDVESREAKLSTPKRPSLRSNLTASVRRLKSAARTFSNLATPTPSQEDDHAPASLSALSTIVPERRPLPWAEPPDPALRRYLNPMNISPVELYSHRNRDERGPKPTASIQLETYWPGAKKSDKASTPPVFMHASSQGPLPDEPTVSTTARQREPRENSDFLRVIVLEMNMRKVGKLSDVTPGRAKLWLPARQAPTQNGDARNETPKRWVSVSP